MMMMMMILSFFIQERPIFGTGAEGAVFCDTHHGPLITPNII